MPRALPVSGDAAGTYGHAFFDKQARSSHQSAGVILPVVFELLNCDSVVDVGCGVGPWLRVSAVPDQGGDGHINERWPGYWAERFAARGSAAHDCVRLPVWHDDRADWWSRHNVLLYVDRTREPATFGEPVAVPPALIHPEMILAVLTRRPVPPHGGSPPAEVPQAPRRPDIRSRLRATAGRWVGAARVAARSGLYRVGGPVRRVAGAGR